MGEQKNLLRVMRYAEKHGIESLGEFIGFVLSDMRNGDGKWMYDNMVCSDDGLRMADTVCFWNRCGVLGGFIEDCLNRRLVY